LSSKTISGREEIVPEGLLKDGKPVTIEARRGDVELFVEESEPGPGLTLREGDTVSTERLSRMLRLFGAEITVNGLYAEPTGSDARLVILKGLALEREPRREIERPQDTATRTDRATVIANNSASVPAADFKVEFIDYDPGDDKYVIEQVFAYALTNDSTYHEAARILTNRQGGGSRGNVSIGGQLGQFPMQFNPGVALNGKEGDTLQTKVTNPYSTSIEFAVSVHGRRVE
jgi:hypothetical protein